jgi:glycine/D-amino acid oxidase-like deaminating enzyme
MHNFDLVFAGNGIVSIVSALKLKEHCPDCAIAIVGPAHRPFSASMAAGAMQAVFCEVEETFHKLSREREVFNIALDARTLWHAFLETFGLRDVITAESTVMYRRKQGTLFEEANFETACDVASEHKCLSDVSVDTLEKIFCGNLKPTDVFAKDFLGEFSIDVAHFFNRTHELLEKMGVTFIDNTVQTVVPSSNGVELILEKNDVIHATRVVIAAGSKSAKLLPTDFKMVPIYHAVGTAMVLDTAPTGYSDLNRVVRTPNRGGAQCGMHVVPRKSGAFYLGAGNYLSDKEPAHRVETIRYLIDICDEELFGKQVVYSAKAQLLLGSRPKSVDGYPVVGSYNACPNIFVATGMYRIGLTIAPVVAMEICHWYEGKQASNHFKNCAPDRPLHSYAPMDVATRYYSESRISNLIEHGLLQLHDTQAIADKKIELETAAKKFNADIVNKHGLAKDFVVDPDMYVMLMSAAANGENIW